jgi:hypothetical protein
VILSIAADFASVRDPLENATVTLEDKPFDAWRFTHFTAGELNDPQVGSAIADPDGDQLANLVEYAMALDPNLPDVSTAGFGETGGYLTLSVLKNIEAGDITWAAEVSADLVNWDDAFILTDTTAAFQARDTVLSSDAERRQIRLRITRP